MLVLDVDVEVLDGVAVVELKAAVPEGEAPDSPDAPSTFGHRVLVPF